MSSIHVAFMSVVLAQAGQVQPPQTSTRPASTAPATAASQSQPADPQGSGLPPGTTNRQIIEKFIALDRADLVEGFRKNGRHSPKWDDQALELLELYIKHLNNAPDAPTDAALRLKADAVATTGCDDPAVELAIGYAIDQENHWSTAEPHLKRAMDGVIDAGYPRKYRGQAARILVAFYEAFKKPDEKSRCQQIVMEEGVEMAKTADNDWLSQYRLTSSLIARVESVLTPELAATMVERLKGIETLNKCTLNVVMGFYETRLGWDARGRGFADEVNQKGWSGFEDHLKKAAAHLTRAYRLDPHRAEAPRQMIAVAMAGFSEPEDNELAWFGRAVAAHVDDIEAYKSMLWSLRPRWGGSYQAMYDFGRKCLTARYDTEVPFVFIRALMDIVEDQQGSFEFWRTHNIYADASACLDQLMADPYRTSRTSELATYKAGFAWAMDKPREGLAALKTLGEADLDREVLKKFGVFERELRDDLRAGSDPAAPEIQKADAVLDKGDGERAARMYADLGAQANDPKVKDILHDREVSATLLRDFQKGDWVPFTFDKKLSGWRDRAGAWRVVNERTIKGGAKRGGGLTLVCMTPFGRRFELKGVINTEELQANRPSNFGVLFGYLDTSLVPDWQSFLIYDKDNVVWTGYRFWKERCVKTALTTKAKTFNFHLQLWDDRARLVVNDQVVFEDRLQDDRNSHLGELIALGGSYGGVNGTATASNLEIRKLGTRPDWRAAKPAP